MEEGIFPKWLKVSVSYEKGIDPRGTLVKKFLITGATFKQMRIDQSITIFKHSIVTVAVGQIFTGGKN